MRKRSFVVAAGALVLLGATALPAQAAPSSGCTFARGTTTCVSTTTTSRALPPVTIQSGVDDGTPSGQWCLATDGPDYPYYSAQDVVFTEVTTTTTTSTYRGRSRGDGRKVTTTSTSSTSYVYTDGLLLCGLFPF